MRSAGRPASVRAPIKISISKASRNANTGLSSIPPAIVHQAQFGRLSMSATVLKYPREFVSQTMVSESLARGHYDGTLPRRVSLGCLDLGLPDRGRGLGG